MPTLWYLPAAKGTFTGSIHMHKHGLDTYTDFSTLTMFPTITFTLNFTVLLMYAHTRTHTPCTGLAHTANCTLVEVVKRTQMADIWLMPTSYTGEKLNQQILTIAAIKVLQALNPYQLSM